MTRRTISGQPNHAHGKEHYRVVATLTSTLNKRAGRALRGVADDIRERERKKQQEYKVEPGKGMTKKCLSLGCEFKHMKGSEYCKVHYLMDYGRG